MAGREVYRKFSDYFFWYTVGLTLVKYPIVLTLPATKRKTRRTLPTMSSKFSLKKNHFLSLSFSWLFSKKNFSYQFFFPTFQSPHLYLSFYIKTKPTACSLSNQKKNLLTTYQVPSARRGRKKKKVTLNLLRHFEAHQIVIVDSINKSSYPDCGFKQSKFNTVGIGILVLSHRWLRGSILAPTYYSTVPLLFFFCLLICQSMDQSSSKKSRRRFQIILDILFKVIPEQSQKHEVERTSSKTLQYKCSMNVRACCIYSTIQSALFHIAVYLIMQQLLKSCLLIFTLTIIMSTRERSSLKYDQKF